MPAVPVDRSHRSPNHGPRPAGTGVDILLLHYTGMPFEEKALAWLCDPRSEVSSHYVVYEDGRIFGLVDEDRRAWHAGRSFWRGITDVNSHSIGIEIANPGHEFGYRSFPDVQVEAVIALCRDILGRHAIAPHDVVAHSDVAPARKEDPGELFPWGRLAAAGIGLWLPPAPSVEGDRIGPSAEGEGVCDLQVKLARYGYGIDTTGRYDAETEAVVRAFQRHFRPARVDGVADASTLATLDGLLAAL